MGEEGGGEEEETSSSSSPAIAFTTARPPVSLMRADSMRRTDRSGQLSSASAMATAPLCRTPLSLISNTCSRVRMREPQQMPATEPF